MALITATHFSFESMIINWKRQSLYKNKVENAKITTNFITKSIHTDVIINVIGNTSLTK